MAGATHTQAQTELKRPSMRLPSNSGMGVTIIAETSTLIPKNCCVSAGIDTRWAPVSGEKVAFALQIGTICLSSFTSFLTAKTYFPTVH